MRKTMGESVLELLDEKDAEIKRLKDALKFRPMDTAPKDGTKVLLVDQDWNYCLAEYRTMLFITKSSEEKYWIICDSYNDEQGGEYTCDYPMGWFPLEAIALR